MHTITFDFTKKGTKIETDGFVNSGCLTELENYQKFMMSEYGIEVQITDQLKKPESFVPADDEKNGSMVI